MSMQHFYALQAMIEELERHGYHDITDDVKEFYDDYPYLCTFRRPLHEQEEGPIYCETVDELLTLLEQVNPALLHRQVWWCEGCHTVSVVRYRKGAGVTEVMELLSSSHTTLAPNCHTAIHVLNHHLVSRAILDSDPTLPAWAKERLASLLFEPAKEESDDRDSHTGL